MCKEISKIILKYLNLLVEVKYSHGNMNLHNMAVTQKSEFWFSTHTYIIFAVPKLLHNRC